MKHLASALACTASRPENWQAFCKEHHHVVRFLLQLLFTVSHDVVGGILSLLSHALMSNEASKAFKPYVVVLLQFHIVAF